jgi:4-diphosphocytidyl-2-C-methyl-D-erythritol kinase
MPSGIGAHSMLARKFGSAWETLAPAKLNLYLEVLGRRPDGFHEVETLMAPIRIYDQLRWEPSKVGELPALALNYHPSTPPAYQDSAPPTRENLVVRAAEALGTSAGVQPTGQITLLKQIPPQAGLGGGSSDAAAALVVANAAWGIHYPAPRLAEIAARLGSDVPFFLAGQSAVCRGRGELVEPVAGIPRLDVVVVKPPFGLATGDVYRLLNAGPASAFRRGSPDTPLAVLIEEMRHGAVYRAARLMKNRLAAAAASVCHWIAEIGAVFDRLSCPGHSMTGSGSAYFGVMRSARHARRAAGMLSSRKLGTVFATATCR